VFDRNMIYIREAHPYFVPPALMFGISHSP
jgi:hypothetical protein